MLYICKGCGDCCKGCNNCCKQCCKSFHQCCNECTHCCDGVCKECCGCWESCCKGISDCFQKTFSAPFSLCTFIVFFVAGVPFILAIIAISKDWNIDECDKPINIHTLIEGICNLLNFLFCVYLCFKYGKKYSERHNNEQQKDEKNILQVTQHLILYDFIVCFYIFLVIFFLVWTIIGSNWLSQISSDSLCEDNHQFLIKICLYNIIVMWIFLILGLIVFIFTILVYACEDGSCTCIDLCRCLLLICSCGFCDIGKRVKKTQSPLRQNYPVHEGWITKSKIILGRFGILNNYAFQEKQNNQIPSQQPIYQNNSNMIQNQMPNAGVQIVVMPNNPQYNNQQYINSNPQSNNQQYNDPQYGNINQNYQPTPNSAGGYNYPNQQQILNLNAENVAEHEKEGKKSAIGQIKDNMKHFKDKIKKYF